MKTRLIIASVFIAALSIRIFHFIEIYDIPFLTTHNTDLHQFMYYARKLFKKDFFFIEKIYFNLLYSLFLYIFHFICGLGVKKIIFIQIFIDSFSAVLTTKITAKISNQRSGLIAGLLYAFYGPLIFYAGLPLATALSIFFLLLSIFFLIYTLHTDKSLLFAFFSGFVFAVTTLARPNVVISLPIVFLLYFIEFRSNKRHLLGLLISLITGFILPLAPFTIHNYITARTLSPYTLHGGLNLYMGNNPQSVGTMQAIEGISSMPGQQVLDSIERASEISGRKLSPKQANAFWIDQVFLFYFKDPFQAFKLLVKKTALFSNTYEFACNNDYGFCKRFSMVLNFPLFSFGLILPLAVLSFVIVRKKTFELRLIKYLFLALSFSVVLFYVSARLRIVCVPFAVILSGMALDRLLFLIKTKNMKDILVSVIILSIFLVLSHVPVRLYGFNLDKTLSISYWNLGRYYFHNKEYSAAVKEFEKSLELDPGNISSLNYLGTSLEYLNQTQKAVQVYKKILESDPANADVIFNIARIYHNNQEWKKALQYYIHASRINPENHIALNTIGGLYLRLNDFQNAEKYFLNATKVKNDYPEPYYNLSIIYFGNKKYELAIKYLNEAKQLGFNPDTGYVNELFSAAGRGE